MSAIIVILINYLFYLNHVKFIEITSNSVCTLKIYSEKKKNCRWGEVNADFFFKFRQTHFLPLLTKFKQNKKENIS